MKKWIRNIEKDDMRVIALIFAVILIAAVVLIIGAANKAPELPESVSFTVSIEDIKADVSVSGITVTSVDTILGMFVEDGTDEVLDDIFTVTFKNTSDRALQYAKLILTVGEEDYVFEISTIPAGASVRAMEMNRKALVPSKGDVTLTQENIVWFDEEPSMCENLLEITPTNNGIVVKNISGVTISAPLYVYYKNYEDEMYVGGITYRAGTQEDLAPGQTVVLSAKHFELDASRLMFVTYAP